MQSIQTNCFHLQTIETENSIDTRDVPIERRKCRFPDERWPTNATLPYSFASCLIYNRVWLEIGLCNCTIHTSPIECKEIKHLNALNSALNMILCLVKHQYCDYRGILCVQQHKIAKKALHRHHIVEPCLPSCTEMEINFVG